MRHGPFFNPLDLHDVFRFWYGRPSMIACAFTGPISGRASASLVAVLMFTFCPGANLGAAAFSGALAFSAAGQPFFGLGLGADGHEGFKSWMVLAKPRLGWSSRLQGGFDDLFA
jgi:hypothetical protein